MLVQHSRSTGRVEKNRSCTAPCESQGIDTLPGESRTDRVAPVPRLQYEAAPPNTISDFVLVNKRASTVNAIAIDALLRRHKTSVTRIDLSYNYLRNSGVISLAYLFRSLPNLSHLDLGDNHIGDVAFGQYPYSWTQAPWAKCRLNRAETPRVHQAA